MYGPIVYSGGFDPIHTDHIKRIQDLAKRVYDPSDGLIVIVEPDSFVAQKHPVFMPQEQRAEILRNIKGVSRVLLASDKVPTSALLEAIRPRAYCIGPDHKEDEIPEYNVCKKHDITIIKMEPFYNENGDEEREPISSTSLLNKYAENLVRRYTEPAPSKFTNPPVTVSAIVRDWGSRNVLFGLRPNGKYDIPGGFLEPNETLEQCMLRELVEETTISAVHDYEYLCSYSGKYEDGRQILAVYFVCKLQRNGKALPMRTPELDNFQWLGEIPSPMYSSLDNLALETYFGG